jgi:DNA polymerase I-like protein with 3'-5' exonuclease and polymerase domains
MRSIKKTSEFFETLSAGERAHTVYKIHGQSGHRLQAKEPNVMQIPEEMEVAGSKMYPREIVIPDKHGDEVMVSDFSQIEFFLYAKQAGCKKVLEAKDLGDYIYGLFYEIIFDKPFFEQLKPRKKAYISKSVEPWELLVAKSFPLGFIYGRTPEGMTTARVDKKRAYKIYDTLARDLMPEVPVFHNKLLAEATRNRYLRSPFGHIRRFSNPKASRNEILAFPGQTTAVGVLFQNALLPFSNPETGLRKYGARLMFSVHDSVINSTPQARRVEIADYVKHTMESPIPQLGGFFIPVEIKVGPNWGKVKLYAAG